MKNTHCLCEKIKMLREKNNMTQIGVAKKLGLTRASVNAWEMGISVPSTQYIIQLSKIFSVSTDYLLGIEKNATINIDGLSEKEIAILIGLINHFKEESKNRDC